MATLEQRIISETGKKLVTQSQIDTWEAKSTSENPVGGWNAATNTPNAAATLLNNNDTLVVTTAGTSSVTGVSIDMSIGDQLKKTAAGIIYIQKGSVPGPKTVSPDRTTFIVQSKNLANPSGFSQDGSYMENTGVVAANASYGYTDFIKVTPGLTYSGSDGINGMRKTTFFDINKNWVSGGSTNAITTFTVPAGIEYVRVSYYVARKSTFQFEQANAPTQFEFYSSKLSGIKVDAGLINQDSSNLMSTASEKASWNAKLDPSAIVYTTQASKNLFNPANIILDSSIDRTNGGIAVNAGWIRTGNISCAAGLSYAVSGMISLTSKSVRFENSTGALVGFWDINTNGAIFQAPAGATQMSITIKRADETLVLSNVQVEQNNTITSHEDYYTPKKTLQSVNGANYIDPANVLQDGTHRFQTDAEKAAALGKLDKSTVLSTMVGASKNIFNPTNIVVDSYIDRTTGNIGPFTGWIRTGNIPCTAGLSYVISGLVSSSSKGVRFEDATGTKVGSFDINTNGTTFVAPAGATQMSITIKRADETLVVSNVQIEVGTVATGLVPYNAGTKTLQSVDGAIIPFTDADKTNWNGKLDKSAIVTAIVGASANLLNSATMTDGGFIAGNNGSYVSFAGYSYSTKIKVTPGLTYSGLGGTTQMRHVAFYDINQTFVAGGYIANTTTFTVPAGVEYVIISFLTTAKSTFMFSQSATAQGYQLYNSGTKTVTAIGDAVIPQGAAVTSTSEKVSLQNSEKVLHTGCSYEESIYALKGKSWIAKLSNLTDWLIGNMGVSGYRMIDVADRLRKDTATYGLQPSIFKPTYITVANNGNEYFPNAGENLDLYMEQVKILVEAIQALGAKPILGTDYHTNSNKYVESALKNYADRHQFPYMGIGLNGEKILSQAYQGFWGGSHPGVRTNDFEWMEWLYFYNQLPRPRKSIKIFRPRLSGQTMDQLNYDTIPQRAERFIELNVGEKSLNESNGSEAYYDRLDEGTTIDPNDENHVITSYTSQTNNNEYALLMSGSAISFTDFALFELIIHRVRVDSFVVTLKGDAGLSFYLKNNNDSTKYESVLRDTELVFQVSEAVYNSFTDAVGALFTSSGVKSGTVQFAYTGKLKSYAMGKGWFLCFSATSDVDQGSRVSATTSITRVSDSSTVATLNQKVPYRYGYSYFANMNKPKGSWYALTNEVAYANGVYTITLPANSAKYFEFDKLKLLASKSGAFNVTGIEADYSGGVPKAEFTKQIEQKAFGTELIATRGFDANWTSTGGWTAGGNSLVSMPVGVRDYPPFLTTTNHIELGFDANGFSQKTSRTITLPVTGTNRRGWQKVIVRVVARMFPNIYNPSQTGTYFSSAPILTKTSYDLGVLCVGMKAPASTNPELVMRQHVGIGWTELTFETTLPIGESSAILEIWRDCEVSNINSSWPMQVYDVSTQLI